MSCPYYHEPLSFIFCIYWNPCPYKAQYVGQWNAHHVHVVFFRVTVNKSLVCPSHLSVIGRTPWWLSHKLVMWMFRERLWCAQSSLEESGIQLVPSNLIGYACHTRRHNGCAGQIQWLTLLGDINHRLYGPDLIIFRPPSEYCWVCH